MLAEVEKDLSFYKISEVDYQKLVTTPTGKEIDCWDYDWMD